jgi:hypothetical protein
MGLRHRDYELTEAINLSTTIAVGDKMVRQAKTMADRSAGSSAAMLNLRNILLKHVEKISELADSLNVKRTPVADVWFSSNPKRRGKMVRHAG